MAEDSAVALPEGFVLDKQTDTPLPEGFTEDKKPAETLPKGFTLDKPKTDTPPEGFKLDEPKKETSILDRVKDSLDFQVDLVARTGKKLIDTHIAAAETQV